MLLGNNPQSGYCPGMMPRVYSNVTGGAIVIMDVLYIILGIVYILGCVTLVAIIMLQKKRAGGMGSIAGMGNAAETYLDKNKSRTMEGALEKYTKIGGAVFFIFSLVLCFL